jgi:isochorismate synthase
MTSALTHSGEARLATLVKKASVRALETGHDVLTSITEPIGTVDPLDALEALSAASVADGEPADIRMYWSRASETFALAGFGAAATLGPKDSNRFEGVESAWVEMIGSALTDEVFPEIPGTGPVLMGGFSFDPLRPPTSRWRGFPDTLFFLPRLQIASVGDGSWLTINVLVGPEGIRGIDADGLAELRNCVLRLGTSAWTSHYRSTAPDAVECTDVRLASEWQGLVGKAVSEIRNGTLEKVVLAREVPAASPHDLNAVSVVRHLRENHRDCYVFGLWRSESAFVGATPERLVRLDGNRVQASSLAGSVRRGSTSAEDTALAAELRSSAKDRKEHEFVRNALISGLGDLCDDIAMEEEPSILSLRQVHHLHTPVRARLRPGHSILDLVARLHPTPAVGGEPREAALAFIRDNELLDRGWYAAPIGWFQRDRGEFAVALRSALITGRRAFLFAGCGIVADSIPEEEYAESILKLRSMEIALGHSRMYGEETGASGRSAGMSTNSADATS